MDVGDVPPLGDRPPDGLVDGPESRPPAHDGKFGAFTPEANLLVRDRVGNTHHLRMAGVCHLLVGGRRIVDVAGAGLLLDAADAVLEAGRTGLDPRPGKPIAA